METNKAQHWHIYTGELICPCAFGPHKGQKHMIIVAMIDKRWPMLPWYGLVTSPCWIPPSCYQYQPFHLRRWLDPVRIPEYWKEFPFSHPDKKNTDNPLAGQKNHLEKPNAWKVWSLKGPLSCSKSKKAKGWVWHLSYWTSDFRLFIFDIKHLNLTQPILEKKFTRSLK